MPTLSDLPIIKKEIPEDERISIQKNRRFVIQENFTIANPNIPKLNGWYLFIRESKHLIAGYLGLGNFTDEKIFTVQEFAKQGELAVLIAFDSRKINYWVEIDEHMAQGFGRHRKAINRSCFPLSLHKFTKLYERLYQRNWMDTIIITEDI